MDYEKLGEWELNEIIARKLGWHVEEINPPDQMWVSPPGIMLNLTHRVVMPDGERQTGWGSEALAWEHADYGNYSESIEDALPLLERTGYALVALNPNMWLCAKLIDDGGYYIGAGATATTAARAISIAWLRWYDSKK